MTFPSISENANIFVYEGLNNLLPRKFLNTLRDESFARKKTKELIFANFCWSVAEQIIAFTKNSLIIYLNKKNIWLEVFTIFCKFLNWGNYQF